MRGIAQPDGRPLDASELRSYCFVVWTKVHCRSLQRRLLIDNILLLSGDIRDQIASCAKSRQNFDVLGRQISRGEGEKGPPKFLT